MNFVERLTKELEDSGMFPDQAAEVMKRFLAEESHTTMGQRVYEPTDNYPNGVYNVLWVLCKAVALKYIDETCPRAWFRPVFLGPKEFAEWKANALRPKEGSESCVQA